MPNTLLPFLGACLVVAAVPGPSTALIIRQSIRGGRRAGFATVLGNETGVFLWGLAAAFGFTALMAASRLAYDGLRFTGAAVLFWFGVQSLRASRRPEAPEADEPAGPQPAAGSRTVLRSYRAGLGVNLANPKAAVFAMSFLPQFVPHGAAQLPAMVALAGAWAGFEVAYYGGYVWFVHRMKAVFAREAVRQRMEQFSGGLLVALGLRMALEG